MIRHLLLAGLLAVANCVVFAQEAEVPKKANARPDDAEAVKAEPYDTATVEEMKKCVELDSAKGKIVIQMFPVTAPNTVRNFLNLTAIGAFDNTVFNRIVPGFVVQGGNLFANPNITPEMSRRAYKTIKDEPNLVRHERGIVSMARSDEANSASTDYFILLRSAPSLDNKFAAFGRVIEGMELVSEINKMPVDGEAPKEPVAIPKASVIECEIKPEAAPKVNELPRFGLRGKVKSVKTLFSGVKGKKKKKKRKKNDDHWIGESVTEFGEIGDYVKATFFNEDGSVRGIDSNEHPPVNSGPEVPIKDTLKDPGGKLLARTDVYKRSATTFDFKSYDGEMNLVRKGSAETNAEGRILKQVYERIDKDGNVDGKFTNTFTYDPYGYLVIRVQTDENGKVVSYSRYEYTDVDDKGNWIERKLFDSEKGKKPVRTEKREIEYYGEGE